MYDALDDPRYIEQYIVWPCTHKYVITCTRKHLFTNLRFLLGVLPMLPYSSTWLHGTGCFMLHLCAVRFGVDVWKEIALQLFAMKQNSKGMCSPVIFPRLADKKCVARPELDRQCKVLMEIFILMEPFVFMQLHPPPSQNTCKCSFCRHLALSTWLCWGFKDF